MITRHDVAQKLIAHVQHRLGLDELVAWAENAMMEEELDPPDLGVLRTILSRLGLADVREFGLTWADITEFLSLLGYLVKVDVSKVA
jgi:hypothetical protein